MKKYTVTGMSCAACSSRVEKAVEKVDGVESCTVNLLTNDMGVEGTASDEAVIAAVERAGYGVSVKGGKPEKKIAEPKEKNDELRKLVIRLVCSVVFLLVLVYFSMGHNMGGWPLPDFFEGNYVAVGLFQMFLAAVIILINRRFFINGFRGIFRGALNMDTLVGMGSGVAFGYSVYILFAMTGAQASGDGAAAANYSTQMYFESSAMILTLITIGKTLETYSKGKTTSALKGLMKLAPQTATVIRDGAEIEIPAEQIVVGDIFAVRPGEHIPADGEVIEGSSSVNESAFTGESVPADKAAGSGVSAGTVNLTGYLKCRSTRVGEDTTLSQIIKTVSDAAATKAPVARIADKVSAVFVPVVIAIAVITLIVWLSVGQNAGYSLARAISVLVISCPCALGLATPVAIMVGNGVGARNGILFKNSSALEQTGKTQIAVLDKTGTVTSGEPSVTDIVSADGTDSSELLRLAYILEKKSEHPLSSAIVKKAADEIITPTEEVSDFEILPGNGLTGMLDGKKLAGGNLAFIESVAVIPQFAKDEAERLSDEGKTPLFFVCGNEFSGIIAVADTIREDSASAIAEMKAEGMKVVMLTGDNRRTAEAIGRIAGVDEVIADVLPDGKADVIRRLQNYGKVAMVGDGINDAPALTQADVGIAIGAGTDVAIDAADVVLVKNRISDVAAAIRLSKSTLTNIKENLFWAFIYNIIGIPLAAGVWIPLFGWEMNPMFGAAAMSLSSFCVVVNALRLNLCNIRKKRRKKKSIVELPSFTENIEIKENEMNKEIVLKIEGMMCAHCEKRVKDSLEAIDGVESVAASHEAGTAVLKTSKDIPLETLKKAVEDQGYAVL